MRKFLISAAVAAGAMTIAAPAAAQWAPPPVYGAPYGNAYGYNNHGQFRSLQVRIDRLEREIRRLDQRNILSNREAARLRAAARDIRNDLRRAARDGLNYRELNRFQNRVVQLEVRMHREARDWNNRGRRYGDRNW